MHYVLIAMAVGAGMLIPVQAGFNSTFKDHAGHPLFGALANFVVGVGVIILLTAGFVLARQATMPSLSSVGNAPWWAWLGGVCGSIMVFTAIVTVRPLGAAGMIACFVTGQLISSVLIDHNGWLNVPKTPASPARLLGVVLLLAGLTLVLTAKRSAQPVDETETERTTDAVAPDTVEP